MGVLFEHGSEDKPKGHALLYFRNSSAAEDIWASYIVVLPITVDIAKYVPPFLMNQVKELGPQDLSAFAFPPAPERIGGRDVLDKLAAARGDDVLFAGALDPADVTAGMMAVNEAVQFYTEIYSRVFDVAPCSELDDGGPGSEIGVSEVMYGLMSENDKLSELTKLAGRLRFGVEGADSKAVSEAEQDMVLLAKYLPANHGVEQLIEAVKSTDQNAADLADLYIQRCYHLVQEDYGSLPQIEDKIRVLEAKLGS